MARYKNFDWMLFFAVFLLCLMGLAAIYSVALSKSENPDFFNLQKQVAGFIIGIILIFIIAAANYRLLKNYRRLIYLIGFILLAGVLIIGQTIRGTTGWFAIGPINFQPVEFAKICLLVLMANYMSERSGVHFNWPQLFSVSILGAAYVGLVFLQPDLGSAVILFLLWFGLLFFGNIRKKFIIILVIVCLVMGIFSWFILDVYQQERILTFLDQSRDPLGQGYNVTQSVIAIGSGGLFGRGLGFGSQSQLKFLPESQTDFIFAVFAEELGLVGVGLILGLFAFVFWRLFTIARKAHDDFSLFLILGIILLLFIQLGMNVAMNLGIFPVTGITLPFLSYGASSLLAFLVLVGIAESIAMREVSTPVQEKEKIW